MLDRAEKNVQNKDKVDINYMAAWCMIHGIARSVKRF